MSTVPTRPWPTSDGVRRLVDDDLADDFGRILVELDAAVVVGRGLLAAVQQGLREVGAEAADGDDVGAAAGALRRDAGQAGDRFADAVVGQLADVFGGDRFDDLFLASSWSGRALEARAEAGDDDFLALGRRGRWRRRSSVSLGRRRRRGIGGCVVCAAAGRGDAARRTAPAGSRQALETAEVAWKVIVVVPLLDDRARRTTRAPSSSMGQYLSIMVRRWLDGRRAIHTYSARYTVASQ